MTFVLAGEGIFRFAQFTDIHIGTGIGSRDLRAVVADVNSLDPPADFVIVSGDVTEYDMGNLLDSAKMILDELDVPYYAIPGNHDTKWSGSGGAKFRTVFGDDKFSFEKSGFRFLGFHQGPVLRMGEGFVSPNDLSWLEKELKKADKNGEEVILIMHYPLDRAITNLKSLLNVLDGHRILNTLHGHGHANRVNDYSGIPGIMSRSTLARPEKAGYTLIEYNGADSLYFREKNPGEMPGDPWHRLYAGTRIYSKPDTLPLPVGGDLDSDHLWQIKSGDLITSAPVLYEDKVIVSTAAGNVYCIDARSGNVIWKKALGSAVYAAAAADRGRMVISRADSLIQCLRLKDGKSLWQFRTGDALVAEPVIAGRTVFCGSSDGNFYALNLRNGKLRWKFEGVEAYVESRPLITDGKVIFTAWDQKMRALDRRSGKLLWTWQDGRSGMLYSPAACEPRIIGDVIYIVAPDRMLSAIDIETGKSLWRSGEYAVRENIASADDGSMLFMKTMFDTVIAVRPDADGFKLAWATSGGYDFDINPAPMLHKGHRVWGTTHYGHLLEFNSENGELLSSRRISYNLLHKPVISEDILIMTALDGKITAVKAGGQ